MTSRTEGVAKGRSLLRWVAGGGVLAIAVLLVGLALAGGTANAAEDGVYTGTVSVVEEGQCGGGTVAVTVSGDTITSIIVNGAFAGGVPLDDFELLSDTTLPITGDVVSETFEPLPGVATTLEATFSGDTFTGTLGVESLSCVGIGLSATLGAGNGTGPPTAGVGPIGGGSGSGLVFWAILTGILAVAGLAMTGVGARIARKA